MISAGYLSLLCHQGDGLSAWSLEFTMSPGRRFLCLVFCVESVIQFYPQRLVVAVVVLEAFLLIVKVQPFLTMNPIAWHHL